MEPKADGPRQPFILPILSQQDAPINATSILRSPRSMERARPPWVLNTTGLGRMHSLEMASASSPRMPLVSMPVMTPERI